MNTAARPTDGIYVRLARAWTHIENLRDGVAGYFESRRGEAYDSITQRDPKRRCYSVQVTVSEPPDLITWSLIAADAVHSLRAALDNLMYASWRKLGQGGHRVFPCGLVDWNAARPVFEKRNLTRIINAIDDLYGGSNGERFGFVLKTLNDLWINDKHATLTIVPVAITASQSILDGGTGREEVNFVATGKTFENNAVVVRYFVQPDNPNIELNARPAFDVRLDKKGPSGEMIFAGAFLVYAHDIIRDDVLPRFNSAFP